MQIMGQTITDWASITSAPKPPYATPPAITIIKIDKNKRLIGILLISLTRPINIGQEMQVKIKPVIDKIFIKRHDSALETAVTVRK